jgi:predicted SAM-dependent methyltransferase
MGLIKKLVKRMTAPRCNICGGRKFTRGPGQRLSPSGRKPLCKRCHSLERHRAFRKIFLALGARRFKTLRCLQFSADPSIDRRWFGQFEVSIYGKENSLDLQRIDRENNSYDVIVCNHVLEHVADHRAALRELARVLSPRGFLFLSVPDPFRVEHTTDWGYPDPAKHAHYRHFGRDVEELFRQEMPECQVVAVKTKDDATGLGDMAYFVTRNSDWLRRVRRLRLETRICVEALDMSRRAA